MAELALGLVHPGCGVHAGGGGEGGDDSDGGANSGEIGDDPGDECPGEPSDGGWDPILILT